ncbi:M48 family metalloprotease [Streptomyces sp. NPDC048751]|uniref:M48 family metalloprotease n=1 Tax=Streptomyces sp. NPDC048751 TaxID=3365591 RepID=UPI0037175348
MVVRALLFCVALMAAAVTIAFPATTSRQKANSDAYSLCWPGAFRQFQLTLPMAPVEREILRQAPVWPPQPIAEEYNPALKRYLREHCPQPQTRHAPRVGLALGVLGGGGFVLYWLSPYQQILFRRLLRLRPTPPAGAPRGYRPDLADAVLRLADDAGVTVHGVWLNASEYTKNAVAFGHVGRRHIELASGMEKLFDEDPDTFQVVVRHELGHIRHRDLDATHGVTALWGAFTVLLAATFCFAVSGYAGDGAYLLRLSFHLALLACTLYAARNAFLQSRELHADAFAVTARPNDSRPQQRREKLDAFFVDLSVRRRPTSGRTRAVFANGMKPPTPGAVERGSSGWPFATHPALRRRRAALRHPALAGELTFWEAALTGCVALLSVNLLLGDSFDVMLTGLQLGSGKIDTLRPVYTWLALPLLLPAGAVLGSGIRHTVAAWGGARGGRALAGRLALLALGLWAGLCAGCMLDPAQTFGDRSVQLRAMWWNEVTGALGLGLALTAALTVLALSLFALVCDAVCGPRAASWWAGAFGLLTTVTWFPTALPGGNAPYLQGVVVGVALLSGALLPLLRRRAGRPAPPPLGPDEPVTRTSVPGTTGPRLLLAHAVTAAVTVGVIVNAGDLLVDTPDTPLALVVRLGLVGYVAVLAGAAAAPHDAEFRLRVRYAVVCLVVSAGAACLMYLGSAVLGVLPVVLIGGAAAWVAMAGRISAGALYAFRHRKSSAAAPLPAPSDDASQPSSAGPRGERGKGPRHAVGRHR